MRVLPLRPALPAKTQARLEKRTEAITASPIPKETAERKYASARKAEWFSEVVHLLKSMAGPGEPCMFCDANEGTDVEHYRPKSTFPELALVWKNLLWGCSACNRYKGDRFPPDTEPGVMILNPAEDNVWEHFFIDEFGNLTPIWQVSAGALDPRAVSTRAVLRLDRQSLQERRLQRLKSLRTSVRDTICRYCSGEIPRDEVLTRLAHWRKEPFQADVADYFLNGPGKVEQPFAELRSLTEATP